MSRKFFFISFLFLILAAGCNNTLSDIGSGFITEHQFDILYTDTVTLRTSTVIFDSLYTSGAGRLLVGFHQDEKLGPTTSSAAFLVTVPSTITTLSTDHTTYTALSVHLIRDGYSYYDTTETQTINVYRIIKPINLYAGYRFNVDGYSLDPTPLGSITISPNPNNKDSVEIYLSDDLGQDLFRKAQLNDPIYSSNTSFNQYLNGLVLIPDTLNSRSFLGFKSTPTMRLYYTDNSVIAPIHPNKYLSFPIGTNFYYNRIHSDRSSTQLAPLKNILQFAYSSTTDHELYIQGGTGLAMRVDMPYLKNLLFVQPGFVATKAILTIKPVLDAFIVDKYLYRPASLSVNLVDIANQTLGVGIGSVALYTDPLGNPSYSLDVTTYVNSEIQSQVSNDNALLLLLPDKDFRSTVNRLYAGDAQNYYQMKATLYFISLTNQTLQP
jgi:hypothetical protein